MLLTFLPERFSFSARWRSVVWHCFECDVERLEKDKDLEKQPVLIQIRTNVIIFFFFYQQPQAYFSVELMQSQSCQCAGRWHHWCERNPELQTQLQKTYQRRHLCQMFCSFLVIKSTKKTTVKPFFHLHREVVKQCLKSAPLYW